MRWSCEGTVYGAMQRFVDRLVAATKARMHGLSMLEDLGAAVAVGEVDGKMPTMCDDATGGCH